MTNAFAIIQETRHTTDIDDQSTGNYTYDAIGNLVTGEQEGITEITWNVYGKISSITKSGPVTITYDYDASGNRIGKTVNGKHTWYVRDASGNVMAVYEDENSSINNNALSQIEVHLYGSARLGMWQANRNVASPPPPIETALTGLVEGGVTVSQERGKKIFELSNHLGNVLVTISDRRVEHNTSGTTIDYYEASVVSASDYYPYGLGMQERKYASEGYRNGFNGQEKSIEIDPFGNSYTAEFWQYDARIGRRWNVDPIYKHSSYECFAGNPIWLIDLNGADSTVYLFSFEAKNKGTVADGPDQKTMEEIKQNMKTIFESNGIDNLEFKIISQDDFMSGKIVLDPTDAIVGIVGATMMTEGGSYISPEGNILPGKTTAISYGFPHYSYIAGKLHAEASNSDPAATTAIGAAHEVWHQYILKADKVFLGDKAPATSHYDETINLNATGYKMGSYLRKNTISKTTLLQHTQEGSVGYIMVWQRIYVTGYFRAVNFGASPAGRDAGKMSTWKHIFRSSGELFKMQLDGLRSFRNSMVGDTPNQ